jgi:hypothetical protein
MRNQIGVVHPRDLWKYLHFTGKAIQHLKYFLQDTYIATCGGYLGQFSNDPHLGQVNIQIAGQGTINDMVQEHQSDSGRHNVEDDADQEGEAVS